MLTSQRWAQEFAVGPEDIDDLVNLLLEKETPLSSQDLSRILIDRHLENEAAAIQEQYKDLRVYNPSHTYEVGQRLIFPVLDLVTGVVTGIRPGDNPDYGDFSVISVEFENGQAARDFAAGFSQPHKLSNDEASSSLLPGSELPTAEDVLEVGSDDILETVEAALLDNDTLAFVGGLWFPRDLMLELNEGHLNLAEAVLDMVEGGPLTTEDILDQIGGLGSAPRSLQLFSMNYTLSRDSRFDEVGRSGQVQWYLTRMEPKPVREKPETLLYTPIDHDREALTDEMLALEEEIGDELSPLKDLRSVTQGTVTLIYPHRRAGTLPLNWRVRHIFPAARRSTRIWLTLVDAHDGETFTGWVMPRERYVYGLLPLYEKYQIPIGAYVTISVGDDPAQVKVDFNLYKARTEWIRLITPRDDQFSFENTKRGIGADYDDLMILGADDLAALDQAIKAIQRGRHNLAGLMKMMLPSLGRLTPQGTVHIKTLYSAINVVRRCPPGPIMATLVSNPDFENMGGDYWRLSST